MSFGSRRRPGFSLVEVTLALGIVTLAILSTLGLLGIGLSMNRDTVARTEAASVAREVITDLQMLRDWNSTSPRLQLLPSPGSPTPSTFYVLPDGTFISGTDFSEQERLDSSYRVDVSFGSANGAKPPAVHVVVSWPTGQAGTGTWPSPASSIYEVVASLKPL